MKSITGKTVVAIIHELTTPLHSKEISKTGPY